KVFVLNWLARMVQGFHNLTILGGAFNKSMLTVFFTVKEVAKAFMGFSEVGQRAWDLDFGGAADAFKKHFNNIGDVITTGKESVKKILNDAGEEIQANYNTGGINGFGSGDFFLDDNTGGGNNNDNGSGNKGKKD